jgi:hypothetical protein
LFSLQEALKMYDATPTVKVALLRANPERLPSTRRIERTAAEPRHPRRFGFKTTPTCARDAKDWCQAFQSPSGRVVLAIPQRPESAAPASTANTPINPRPPKSQPSPPSKKPAIPAN